ncbi:hypothetical protein Tco_0318751 [Tanacetum coccineum]
METRIRDTERKMTTTLEMVNMRVSYQVDVRSRESSEFYSRHHDAQKDRAAVRAKIERQRVTVLETESSPTSGKRQAVDDFAVQADHGRYHRAHGGWSTLKHIGGEHWTKARALLFRECAYSEFLKCKPLDNKRQLGSHRTSRRMFGKMEDVV